MWAEELVVLSAHPSILTQAMGMTLNQAEWQSPSLSPSLEPLAQRWTASGLRPQQNPSLGCFPYPLVGKIEANRSGAPLSSGLHPRENEASVELSRVSRSWQNEECLEIHYCWRYTGNHKEIEY